jgi:thiamine-phosphate pyrophosphorylase
MPRNITLPKIYPITDRMISGLSHREQTEKLIIGGASFIQVRDKSACSKHLFESSADCLELAREKNVRLMVNDRADIVLSLRADGVHLGQNDLPPAEARRLLGDEAIIGFSTHTLEQVREAKTLPIDYIAFGPIFETATKPDRDPLVGLENLRRAREEARDFPLVAIGGVTLENLGDVLDAGADSAAMISSLLREPEHISARMKTALGIADLRR